MNLFSKATKTDILPVNVDISNVKSFRDARLVYVKGLGKFEEHWYKTAMQDGDMADIQRMFSFELNGIPLMQLDSIWTGTTAGYAATGYGIEKADCKELYALREQINKPFESLDRSIETLRPVLELLHTGLYVIADAVCYPTDGNGSFFWSVPNGFNCAQATVVKILYDPDVTVVENDPVFVYPSQSTDKYNAERVEYYKTQTGENMPRALAYNICSAQNLLLDGHHKACAAALKKQPFNCLLILPFSHYQYCGTRENWHKTGLYFGKITIPAAEVPKKYLPEEKKAQTRSYREPPFEQGQLVNRKWEDVYTESAHCFPNADEFAEITASGLDYREKPDADKLIGDFGPKAQRMLSALLMIMRYREPETARSIALRCAKKEVCADELKFACFKVFSDNKNDEEIIDFYVDFIVNFDSMDWRPGGRFLDMAHEYLDNCGE